MKDLLGGKGAGLAEMTQAGLPTPPGFTITTAACNDYFAAGEQLPDGLWEDVLDAMREVERRTGKGFGDAGEPAPRQRPLRRQVLHARDDGHRPQPRPERGDARPGLVKLTGNERFGWDAYRRFIQMFGRIVMDVKAERFDEPLEARKHAHGKDARDTDLTVDDLKALVAEFKERRQGRHRPRLPDRPATSSSTSRSRRSSPRGSASAPRTTATARRSRTTSGPPSTSWPWSSATWATTPGPGVAFTRNPNTGDDELFGEYLTNAQGEDVVAGVRTPAPISELQRDMPDVYAEFLRIGKDLEKHYRNVQDLEFTIERGRLYMLQTRDAKRTAAAAVRIAVDMVDEGVISKEEAVGRIEPAQVDQLLRATFDPAALKTARRIVKGLNASPGAAVGKAVFDADTAVEWVDPGRAGHPRPDRDLAGRLPRHGRGRGHHHRPRRGHLPRRGGRPPDRQAVRRRLRRARRRATAPSRRRARITGIDFERGRLAQPRRHDRRPVPGPAADRAGPLRGPARAPEDPRLGRRDPADGRLDQRRQARGGRPGPRLRRGGHRPVPDGAHVPRGRAAGDRPRRDPGRQRGDAGQGKAGGGRDC